MKIPTKPNNTNIRLAYLEKFEEREAWHKLVVKVISWKDGLLEGGTVQLTDKISLKEWETYCKRMLKTNTSRAKDQLQTILEETKQAIKSHGGFLD